MPFDHLNKHFTCPYGEKLKPNGTKTIYGVLNDEYITKKCPECPYKKTMCQNTEISKTL